MTVVEFADRRQPATDWSAGTPEERQAAGRDIASAAMAAGNKVTGAELANQHGGSERWWRDRLAEVRANGSAAGERKPAGGTAGRPGPGGNGKAAGIGTLPSPTTAGSRQPASPVAAPAGSRPALAGNGSRSVAGTLPSPGAGDRQPADPAAAGSRQRPRTVAAGSRQPARAGSSWPDLAILISVGLIAAAASFGHQYTAARVVGEPWQIAVLWPFTVDGLAFVAMRANNRLWLRVGLAISIATNVIARAPELTEQGLTPLVIAGVAIAAWPPVSVYGVHAVYERRHRGQGPR